MLEQTPGRRDFAIASIMSRFNPVAENTAYAVQFATLVVGGGIGGLRGMVAGLLINALDFTLLHRGGAVADLARGQRAFVDRHWAAISATPQFQLVVKRIESDNWRPLDGSLPLLNVELLPAAVKNDLKIAAIKAGLEMTAVGTVRKAARYMYRRVRPGPAPL